jgi:hypothetical protein
MCADGTVEPREVRWVDPREFPDPPLGVPPRPPAPDVTELLDLLRLCREGRVYEVETWIKSGRPLQAIDYRHGKRSHRLASPLKVAVETGQFDLARLLLCNGFLPDLEQESILEVILRTRAKVFLDLLISWGADPKRVKPETVIDTYEIETMEMFWEAGVDLTAGHDLALTLARVTGNKPAYGWCKRHRDDPRVSRKLDMALGHAVMEGEEKAVSLLLWAGADPHRKAPMLGYYDPEFDDEPGSGMTAVHWAVSGGKPNLLRRLKPDPQLDDFESLWRSVCDPETLELLAPMKLPAGWNEILLGNLVTAVEGYHRSSEARRVIELASTRFQARLTNVDSGTWSNLRRAVLRAKDTYDVRWALKWLKSPENCDPGIFEDLSRTPAMKKKLIELKVLRLPPRRRGARMETGDRA